MNTKTVLLLGSYVADLALSAVAAVGIFKVATKELHIKPLKEDYEYDLEDEINEGMDLSLAIKEMGGLDADDDEDR